MSMTSAKAAEVLQYMADGRAHIRLLPDEVAALTLAIAALSAERAEPVAWQHRVRHFPTARFPDPQWNPWSPGRLKYSPNVDQEERPLYTAPPAPVVDDAVGCAEKDVGRWVYVRIEKLMSAKSGTPAGAELDMLSDLVANIEEYGLEHCADHELKISTAPPAPALVVDDAMREKIARLINPDAFDIDHDFRESWLPFSGKWIKLFDWDIAEISHAYNRADAVLAALQVKP